MFIVLAGILACILFYFAYNCICNEWKISLEFYVYSLALLALPSDLKLNKTCISLKKT